jgi:hypothetical protein
LGNYFPNEISDLTKINVKIDFTVDTTDIILIATTGGIGYLAKKVYEHFSTMEQRKIDVETENFLGLIKNASAMGASKIVVRIHRNIPIIVPANSSYEIISEDADQTRIVEISFKTARPPSNTKKRLN